MITSLIREREITNSGKESDRCKNNVPEEIKGIGPSIFQSVGYKPVFGEGNGIEWNGMKIIGTHPILSFISCVL